MSRLAREHGLHLLYKEEFHNIFEAERSHQEYKPLLQRMKVVSASGESQMDEDQWDAASAYFRGSPTPLQHPLQLSMYRLTDPVMLQTFI
jgi:mRNA (guanine-N(7))-methyltransferase domain